MHNLLIVFLLCVTNCRALEEPKFEILQKHGNFELRKYEALPIVSTPMESMNKGNDAFRSLFRYIRGENENNTKISMTAPVFMDSGTKSEKNGRMSFYIPATVAAKGAPTPNADQIVVSEIEAGSFAVLRFKGWKDEDKRREAKAILARHLSQFALKPIGQPFFAYYNPPWTPEFFRRNEIWQRVETPELIHHAK